MADNKSKIDRIHEQLPSHFNSKSNPNWSALIKALGEVDQDTANLVAEVRRQFFVKTASRPYLDRLAANNKISRPRLVGMDDQSFRDYIPVMSYQPKQVKLIIDQLLDIFFFKESTTAFITSQSSSPFALADGWELEMLIDETHSERIVFKSNEFTNIAAAKADEVVAAINRQSKHSYATAYYDSITKDTYIKLFTNTIGSKGSIRIKGGRANIAIRFNGFINAAGTGVNTQWTVTRIGDSTTFQHVGGSAPGIDNLQEGDIVVINLPGNQGSFEIKTVDLASNKISFINLFSTPGTYTQTSSDDVKFIRPNKYVAYTNPRRAMTWETSPGEIVVEMPTSPPVVKRSLKGSIHVNGVFSNMSSRDSDTSLTVNDATGFPESGSFWLEQVNETQVRLLTDSENTLKSYKTGSRLEGRPSKYNYTSRVVLSTTGDITEGSSQILNLASVVGISIGQDIKMDGIPSYAKVVSISGFTVNISVPATLTATAQPVKFMGDQLTGISPNLPAASDLNEFTLTSLTRSSNTVTGTTSSAHGYSVGEYVIISGSSGILTTSTTGTVTSGSATITSVASVSGLGSGMIVTGTGIPANTKVVDIIGNTIIMSKEATSTAVATALTFFEDLNVAAKITAKTSTTFSFSLIGSNGTATTAGTSRVERVGMSVSGSKVIVTDAVQNSVSRITGAYIWDQAAPFVLSSDTAEISDEIKAGRIVRLLNIGQNTIPNNTDGGFIVFDYGLSTQEGPVRYLYKPTSTTIAIDPSYVFQKNHSIGSSVVAIRKKGPHIMSGKANEYPAYITNPSEARLILEELIKSVKSAGIFVNFLVRYPEQLYSTLDVYQSGVDPG